MEEISAVASALSDVSRLRILAALRVSDLCVCQVAELLDLAHSTVSRHLSVLRGVGLVRSWREGKWVVYGLSDVFGGSVVASALGWVFEFISSDPVVVSDADRLKRILREPRERLCRLRGGV